MRTKINFFLFLGPADFVKQFMKLLSDISSFTFEFQRVSMSNGFVASRFHLTRFLCLIRSTFPFPLSSVDVATFETAFDNML